MRKPNSLRICCVRGVILAIPFAVVALLGISLLGEHLSQIIAMLGSALHLDWRALRLEFAARYPELAGIIIGQILLLAFVLHARAHQQARENHP